MDMDQGIMGEAHFSHISTNLIVRNNVFAHSLAWGICLEDIDHAQIVTIPFSTPVLMELASAVLMGKMA
jgi:hypothetical protein